MPQKKPNPFPQVHRPEPPPKPPRREYYDLKRVRITIGAYRGEEADIIAYHEHYFEVKIGEQIVEIEYTCKCYFPVKCQENT